jgi:hypothetical protein
MSALSSNPRAVIGGNNPPSAIDLAKPTIADLAQFLADHPVIANDDEAREAHAVKDRTDRALKGIEAERKDQVAPLNQEVAALNAKYHEFHNTDRRNPGTWDRGLAELMVRLNQYARKLEADRIEAANRAREAQEAAERAARQAAEQEEIARQEAADGVCDVDITGAIEDARTTSAAALKAGRVAARAVRDTKVRIGGGLGKVMTFRNREVLTVTDWKAAIDDMTDDDGDIPIAIVEAILTAARAFRSTRNRLPAGIAQTFDRSL